MPITSVVGDAGVALPPDPLVVAQTAYASAIGALATAIAALRSNNLSTVQSTLLQSYFVRETFDNETLAKIAHVLEATLLGLHHYDIQIRVCFFNFVPMVSVVDPATGQTKKVRDKNNIALAIKQFNNERQCVRYLIHEATHAYADTNDHAERGYIKDNKSYKPPGITAEEALNNADTYSCLVVGFASIDLI